jgi:ATP-dependent DNA ligase
MMNLTTTGRRSGQDRSVMLGYFDDGSNLVTLAMNGWAEEERARLWARWREIDKNLDGFAALRSSETAVVVLEPHPEKSR